MNGRQPPPIITRSKLFPCLAHAGAAAGLLLSGIDFRAEEGVAKLFLWGIAVIAYGAFWFALAVLATEVSGIPFFRDYAKNLESVELPLSIRLRIFRLKIPQQPVKGFLIVVMVSPVAEVSYMPVSPYTCCPRLLGVHYGIIQTDWE